MSRVVNITEAKAQLSRLVDDAQRGQRVIIGRAGKPVAVLSAYETDDEPRVLGGWEGQVWIAEDFDEPLPDELQRLFDGHGS
jgi:prevent-host-death family protein